MKKNKERPDERVKSIHFSIKAYLITYFVLLVLSAGQWLIYAEYIDFGTMPIEYIFGMLGYWGLVSASFILITHSQIRRKFDAPMRKVSKAAKEVAEGDFSIYLEPIHTSDKYDYVDVMYMDFNKMVEELGSIETLTNDFIANVSHEIKTPLSIIQNYAAALQNDSLPEEVRKDYSNTIITASQKLNTLVVNILRLNKLDNQDITLPEEPYDVCKQLCDCALQFENLWEEKDIDFTADIEDKAMIRADAGMLEIVWQNLLSNALKFTEPGGRVALVQTSDNDSITVSVSDTGCGMSKDTMRHIFDKFYQGDTSHSVEGNGLGLALAYRVIEKSGGHLKVTSEPGKGSTFTVTIPLNY
ncbi:HAMP domain-containing sensor histidine kinase [Lacrimispora sp.]|uniref:HAMP domain-containing sensor histidine kinase n=1 Tax=Lacrimispora sp. TaxID=2719234 RepID=UPI002FD9293C